MRIQSRLFDIIDDAQNNVYFTVTSGSLGGGLERQIENFVSEHPDLLSKKLLQNQYGLETLGIT